MNAIDSSTIVVPYLTALKASGVTAIGRYYSTQTWKIITRREADAIRAAGLQIFAVFEDGATPDDFDQDRGVFAGQHALASATALEQDPGSAIYFAVDFDVDDQTIDDRIVPYFQSIAGVLGQGTPKVRIGIYGNGLVCRRLLDAGLAELAWLSQSTGHREHRKFYESRRWAIAQGMGTKIGGLGVDPDEVSGDFGAFPRKAPAVAVMAVNADLAADAVLVTGNFYTDVIQRDGRFHSAERIDDLGLLEPGTRAQVESIVAEARQLYGIDLMVFETYRSTERQEALYAQGATKLKKVGVHHYGLACDLVKSVNGQPSWKGDFSFLGQLARRHGLIWGGDWGTPGTKPGFVDDDHVQRCTVGRQASLFAGSWYPDADYDPYLNGIS